MLPTKQQISVPYHLQNIAQSAKHNIKLDDSEIVLPFLVAESYMSYLYVKVNFFANILQLLSTDFTLKLLIFIESFLWTLMDQSLGVVLQLKGEFLESSADEANIGVEADQSKGEDSKVEQSKVDEKVGLGSLDLKIAKQRIVYLKVVGHVDFMAPVVSVVDSMYVFLAESFGLQGQIFDADLKVMHFHQKLFQISDISGVEGLQYTLLGIDEILLLLSYIIRLKILYPQKDIGILKIHIDHSCILGNSNSIDNIVDITLQLCKITDFQVESISREEIRVCALVCVDGHEAVQEFTMHINMRVDDEQYFCGCEDDEKDVEKGASWKHTIFFVLGQ